MTATPEGLLSGGEALWVGVVDETPDLDTAQLAMLEQACRMRDRADLLAPAAAKGDPGALRHERESGMQMTRLLAAMRIPDPKTGKRAKITPVRGTYAPAAKKLSARERLAAAN